MNGEQFRAILWLRWRLTRNQLARSRGLGTAIAIVVLTGLTLLALGLMTGGVLVGALVLKDAGTPVMMLVWDGVTLFLLFLWIMGVLTEVQRSESIDLTRLLHLPIGLRQVFFFNYFVSLVSFGPVIGTSALLGLSSGLVLSRGPRFLLGLPLALAFVFMITAWVYCLRGWLLALMVNPRRRRAIIMWITLGTIFLSQAPQLINLAAHRNFRKNREARQTVPLPSATQSASKEATGIGGEGVREWIPIVAQVNAWVPVLWLPNGMRTLAAGQSWPALWGATGMVILGWLGLSRSYRATLNFYRASERKKPTTALIGTKSKLARPVRNWVEGRLPWVPEDAAGLAMAQLRSMTRAPEIRLMLAMAIFMAILLPVMLFWRRGLDWPAAVKPFVGTMAVALVLLMLVQLICNQFGFDRDGFRGLVLSPMPRDRLLLGKNLALLPLATFIAIVPLGVAIVLARLSWVSAVATLLQFVAAFLLFCTAGNLTSILAPFRIAPGSLKPSKQSGKSTLFMMLVHLLFPLAIAPVFIPPVLALAAASLAHLHPDPVDALASAGLLAVLLFLYARTLGPLGHMFQRRETKILQALTEIQE